MRALEKWANKYKWNLVPGKEETSTQFEKSEQNPFSLQWHLSFPPSLCQNTSKFTQKKLIFTENCTENTHCCSDLHSNKELKIFSSYQVAYKFYTSLDFIPQGMFQNIWPKNTYKSEAPLIKVESITHMRQHEKVKKKWFYQVLFVAPLGLVMF